MKYLETNAIRKHASRIGDKNFILDKYTSILSLLELVSGIKDNESFKLRQSIIKKIINSKIKIDLTLPELVIYNSFGFDLSNSEISYKIGKIIKLVELTKDYESLLKTIELNALDDAWLFVKQYDENANTGLKKSLLKRFSDSEVKQLIVQFKDRWSFDNLKDLKSKVIEYYATILLQTSPVKCEKSIPEIISSYDNSIDIYLIVTAFYMDEKISYKNMPGKNDYFDLNHLTYLHRLLDQIVTDDKLLHNIMNKTYPENILRTEEI
jgi:hypothetical protein